MSSLSFLFLSIKIRPLSRSVSDGHVSLPFYTANTGLSELVEVGSWVPAINAGCVITSHSCVYCKIGRLVFITAALWIDSSNGNGDNVAITAPFVNSTARVYGTVGYFENMSQFPNMSAGIVSSNTYDINIFYASGDSTTEIKGKQMKTIQLSMTYITNK